MTSHAIDDLSQINPPRPLEAKDSPDSLSRAIPTFFRYWSPRILSLMFLCALAGRLMLGGYQLWDLAVMGAILAWWPVQEWLIHVFILHFKPRKILGIQVDPAVPRKHREHHWDPTRLDLLFIPVHVYLYAPVLLGGIFWLALPTTGLALTGLGFYMLLSLHYEWAHYLVHTRYIPKSWYYKRLWTHHRLHHYKNEHYWFGVSMTSGDLLLRTRPEHKGVPTSPTCRTLGLEETLGRAN